MFVRERSRSCKYGTLNTGTLVVDPTRRKLIIVICIRPWMVIPDDQPRNPHISVGVITIVTKEELLTALLDTESIRQWPPGVAQLCADYAEDDFLGGETKQALITNVRAIRFHFIGVDCITGNLLLQESGRRNRMLLVDVDLTSHSIVEFGTKTVDGLAQTPDGSWVLSDVNRHQVLQYNYDWKLQRMIGQPHSWVCRDGLLDAASFIGRMLLHTDDEGNVYVRDSVSPCLRKITPGLCGTVSSIECGTSLSMTESSTVCVHDANHFLIADQYGIHHFTLGTNKLVQVCRHSGWGNYKFLRVNRTTYKVYSIKRSVELVEGPCEMECHVLSFIADPQILCAF